jgi:hypothetical protein
VYQRTTKITDALLFLDNGEEKSFHSGPQHKEMMMRIIIIITSEE